MAIVYLGLGSNLGNRRNYLRQAVKELNAADVRVEKMSSIIETEPEGGPPQDRYLNAVCRARTDLSPEELLSLVKAIEKKLGRKAAERNAPREIDIDILFYDRLGINLPGLTIPHPRARERAFVLGPLKEIAPGFIKNLEHDNR